MHKIRTKIYFHKKHLYFRSVTQADILQEVEKLNADPNVHGIIVQMPLKCDDPNIDSHLITNAVR